MARKLMGKEELVQFLKDNLSLSIEEGGYDYYSTGVRYTIKLKLGDETISEDYMMVSTNNG